MEMEEKGERRSGGWGEKGSKPTLSSLPTRTALKRAEGGLAMVRSSSDFRNGTTGEARGGVWKGEPEGRWRIGLG